MHIVLLLAIGIALAYFAKPKDQQSYQMALLAIIGVAFFSVWRFTEFYLDVIHVDATIKNSIFAGIMFVALGLGLLPQCRAITRRPAIILAVIFVITLVITFAFEVTIKNKVAAWGGYFDHAPGSLRLLEKPQRTQTYAHAAGGFSLDMPMHWNKTTHSSGLDYFVLAANNQPVAEMRPRCFHDSDIALPEIISNMIQTDQANNLRAETKCYLSSTGLYTCSVKSYSAGEQPYLTQWRWLVADEYQQQSIELDFIIYSNTANAVQDVQAIIDSLNFKPLASPLPLCPSPVEWR